MPTRAIVIGETTLAAQCAQLLRTCGHSVEAAFSQGTAPLKRWADSSAIPHFTDIADLTGFASILTVDYLFSIVNYSVLPSALLGFPCLCINYHDGPLPLYAGLYATSWAIINGETRHGITWHVMIDRIDAGDILKQTAVPITGTETVHSLNVKCHVAAFRTFAVLVRELDTQTVARTPQDLTRRTYYGRSRWKSTVIPWDWTADAIDRFCRALAFHPESNPIGEPTVELNGTTFTVSRAIPCPGTGKPPGSIVHVGDAYIQVATARGDVRLEGVRSLNGREVNRSSLKESLLQ